jgi:hypothetical protein
MLKADELPFISKFYQPDGIQLEALDFFEELDDQQMSRVLLMVGKIKEVVIRSILLTNSTLLQIDCNNIVDKADLHNNACERCVCSNKYFVLQLVRNKNSFSRMPSRKAKQFLTV